MLFTVIVPTSGDGRTLAATVRSALAQTIDDLEVVVVANGVGEAARPVVDALAQADPRVRLRDEPRGSGAGEAHLVRALAGARGQAVAYLVDGDLWAPDHLEVVRALLRRADLAQAFAVEVGRDGPRAWSVDLADPVDQARVLAGEPAPPLSALAHTAAAERRLSLGWRVVPGAGPADDLVRQLLAEPASVASSRQPTVVVVPDAGARLDVVTTYETALADPAWRARELVALALRGTLASWRETDDRLRRIVGSPPWVAVDQVVTKARRVVRRLRGRAVDVARSAGHGG